MTPMLIGHSQGGIQAVKVLYELAGAFGDSVRVWNPLTDAAEDRTTIVDPLTGRERPVVGLRVGYVSVVGAGGAALLLPNQWIDGRQAAYDPGHRGGVHRIHDRGRHVRVGLLWRSLELPEQRHARRCATSACPPNTPTSRSRRLRISPATKAMRDWLNAYRPGDVNAVPADSGSTDNALWAADVWFSIKKHWVIGAQRLIRARRTLVPQD